MVIAAALAVEIVTEPVGVTVMFPAVPPDAADVVSAEFVAAETTRSSAELGVENATAMALDNNTWRIFKITPVITSPAARAAAPQRMDAEALVG